MTHAAHHFLPPYLLERVASQAEPGLGHLASRTLLVDRHFRSRAETLDLPEASAEEGQPLRYVYTANQEQTLPGKLIRQEGEEETGDITADEAYAGLGATYRFFWDILGRHSIDEVGMALLATVHYGQDYVNAFWNGTQMVFGDGDGELFNRFTIALDIIGHELAHGVIGHEAKLIYQGQSGALNESIADVLGSLVKQYHHEQTVEDADWLVGEGLFTERVNGRALRSMANPGTAYDDRILGKDPQPAHMRDFVVTEEDNGGVHINSGIPNKAFYLAAMVLGGNAWDAAGRVWYATLTDPRLPEDSDFATFAEMTLQQAGHLYGALGREQQAIRDAWRDVGVDV
ncbi:M4 family metallopeptidase [Pistricoccus aurantiacus]|uniref:M4 family metallopeptidase n=1 Tax=Pistricoccus aurantiacus TaxID=1883414 RepID=UPI00362C1536